MKDSSQTQFALLGLLELKPMSGYDLKRLADDSIAHFWREGWGRIYPSLHRLESAGMVKKSTEKKTSRKRGRPERNVYALRTAGRKRLREWLGRDWSPQVYRNELLLKVFFGRSAAAGVTERHVQRFREQCETEIAAYEEVLARIGQEPERKHPDAPFWRMTVSYGLYHARGLKQWADETLAELRAIAAG